MSACERHEIELSALLDGESSPQAAIQAADHLAECAACRKFYRRLRAFQAQVDELPAGALRRGQQPQSVRRRSRLDAVPARGWPLAAILILALGLIAYSAGGHRDAPPLAALDQPLIIQLEQNKGQMSDLRFVEVTTELLQADRRYHRMMFEILQRLQDRQPPEGKLALLARTRGEDRPRERGDEIRGGSRQPNVAN